MLLLLTLIHIFNGFQTYAAPLSGLLAESGGNATVSSTSMCLCPADQRSVWDILWSSLATIFACSWVSVHPNIPGPDEPWWRIFLRRLELMFWAVVGPELLIVWALRQWSGARALEKLYEERGWTKAHGYFIQMGGLTLFEGEDAKGVLSPERFSKLLTERKIEFPTLTVEEIGDRSKGDGFSKMIALGQTLWFIVQCIARRTQHLDLTLVELLTLSLAVLNGVMYFLWWHKPLDVRCPVRVYLLDKLDEPCEAEAIEDPVDALSSTWKWLFSKIFGIISTRRRQIYLLWEFFPILCKAATLIICVIIIPIVIAILAFTLPILFTLIISSFLFPRWASILLTYDFNVGDMKVPTFYSFKPNERRSLGNFLLMSATGTVFGGIHCAGWFFIFPSSDEAILWRVCSAVLTSIAFLLPLLIFLTAATLGDLESPFVSILANITATYILSRLFLLVEAFISLRHLTPGMLALFVGYVAKIDE